MGGETGQGGLRVAVHYPCRLPWNCPPDHPLCSRVCQGEDDRIREGHPKKRARGAGVGSHPPEMVGGQLRRQDFASGERWSLFDLCDARREHRGSVWCALSGGKGRGGGGKASNKRNKFISMMQQCMSICCSTRFLPTIKTSELYSLQSSCQLTRDEDERKNNTLFVFACAYATETKPNKTPLYAQTRVILNGAGC